MMNQTDSQSDSIKEEKPLSLDQQQTHERVDLVHGLYSEQHPNLPNMDQTDSQSDTFNEEKPLSLDQQQQHEMNIAADSHASSSGDVSKGPNLANNLGAQSDAEMMNQTHSKLDSINEEKPLSLDQQQHHERVDLVDGLFSSQQPNLPNMNQTNSQSDSINEEKPLSLDQQQQHEMNIAVDSHASSSGDVSKGPNLANNNLDAQSDAEMMNQTHSKLDSINEEKPSSLDQQQKHEINNAIDSHASSRPVLKRLTPNLPNRDLLRGLRKDYLNIGVPLYKASVRGDWEAAKAIFDKYPRLELVRYSITENGETALHVAASTKSSKEVENFVKNLVKLMTKEDLELENENYNTALYLAAAGGNIKQVKTMMEKNPTLHAITGAGGTMYPLYAAALFGNYEVVKYLYEKSNDLCHEDGWTSTTRGWLVEKCMEGDMFDIALKIIHKYPKLGSSGYLLSLLAQKPEAFREEKTNIIQRTIKLVFSAIGLKAGPLEKEPKSLQLLKILWNDLAERPKRMIDDIMRGPPTIKSSTRNVDQPTKTIRTYPSRILFVAAELGNTKFVVELIRQYPDLIWKVNDNNLSIFHIAVKHRHEGIYNLLYEIGSMKDLITPLKDDNWNTMLHLAAKGTTIKRLEDVSGAALQMQRQLLWFKEVWSIMPPSYRLRKNKDGLTARELFTVEHHELMKQGEEWMKSTASQCMVVATLIATIVFAAAFTVPGGYNQNNGIPTFNRKVTFVVFVVADAISLVLSSTSILTFLSILTSRYAERDFERSLPMKLMLGLSTLFLSITAMMITFGVSFFVLYHNEMKWIPISIGVIAIMPVVLYVVLQYHLLIDVIRSAYGGKYLFKPTNQVLFYENPRI